MTKRPSSRIPQKYLTAIGLVAVTTNYAEFTLELLIWKLAKINTWETGSAIAKSITNHMTVALKIHVAGALLDIWFIDRGREMYSLKKARGIHHNGKSALNTFDRLYGERNKIIHGFWKQQSKKTAALSIVSTRGKLKPSKNIYGSLDEIYRLINDMNDVAMKLFDTLGAV